MCVLHGVSLMQRWCFHFDTGIANTQKNLTKNKRDVVFLAEGTSSPCPYVHAAHTACSLGHGCAAGIDTTISLTFTTEM